MSVAPSNLRLLFTRSHNGSFNMEFDELLLKSRIEKKDSNSVLRFYRFSEPVLTIGYGMWRAANSNLKNKTPFIRRITGGGIVAHTEHDLTFALVVPVSAHPNLKKVRESYLFIHNCLSQTFKMFGINTELYECKNGTCESEKVSYCFDSPVTYDVMLQGKKLAGGGQKRSLGYLLHQGSIAWNLVLQVNAQITEEEFGREFARILAQELDQAVEEASPSLEALSRG